MSEQRENDRALIAAIDNAPTALPSKTADFVESLLCQVEAGRTLSARQRAVLEDIYEQFCSGGDAA